VVLEEVRVFVEVDGFEGEFAQPLAAVGVGGFFGGDAAAAEFGAGAVLVVHCVVVLLLLLCEGVVGGCEVVL
jgi:hypothetical protein